MQGSNSELEVMPELKDGEHVETLRKGGSVEARNKGPAAAVW